eukprot:scaffold1294_cov78-Cylindrotheca_fusiformis.AAC.4
MLETSQPVLSPRRDQGSVEKANQANKRIIARMTAVARFLLQRPEEKKKITWVTQQIPCTMRAMNSMYSMRTAHASQRHCEPTTYVPSGIHAT